MPKRTAAVPDVTVDPQPFLQAARALIDGVLAGLAAEMRQRVDGAPLALVLDVKAAAAWSVWGMLDEAQLLGRRAAHEVTDQREHRLFHEARTFLRACMAMMSVGEQGAVLRRLEDRGDGAGTGWLRVVSQFEGDAWELQVRVLLADGTAWASVAHLSGTLEGHQNGAHGDLLAA